MAVVPTGRHILTPYRRLFNQVAPVIAYGLARDAYQLGRTYLHARLSQPSNTGNIVSNIGSNRFTTRSSNMVRGRSYKRKRVTRSSYRAKRRRTSRFRRRRFSRRIPRNRFNLPPSRSITGLADRSMTLAYISYDASTHVQYGCCAYRETYIDTISLLLLLSTPLHQRAASRVQHPKSCGSQQSPPRVARKGSTLSGFVQRSRLEREVGRDLHSNKWEEV